MKSNDPKFNDKKNLLTSTDIVNALFKYEPDSESRRIEKEDLEKIEFQMNKSYRFILERKVQFLEEERTFFLKQGWYAVPNLELFKHLEKIILAEFFGFELKCYEEIVEIGTKVYPVRDNDPIHLKKLFNSSFLKHRYVTTLEDETDVNIYVNYIKNVMLLDESNPNMTSFRICYFVDNDFIDDKFAFFDLFKDSDSLKKVLLDSIIDKRGKIEVCVLQEYWL